MTQLAYGIPYKQSIFYMHIVVHMDLAIDINTIVTVTKSS